MRRAILLAIAAPLWAQDSLSVREAVQLALRENKAIAGVDAAARASTARIDGARSGWLPKLNYSESWVRSDNPVFVFSSLLTQHQFGVENFNIGPLNRPDAMNNFQSLLSVDQPLYDAGQTRNAVKSAGLSRQMTAEEKRRTEMQVISGVVRAYYGAVLAAESLKTAEQAVRSAEADLKRAESVHAAGMSTDVDVLSIRVHLATVTEQRIQRAADLDVAQSALNDVLGVPLDTRHKLTTELRRLDLPEVELASFERDASSARPEARASHLEADLAKAQVDSAKSALLPQVAFHGAFEADRQQFINKGGANWLASIGLRWNLFNGNEDRAKIEESRHWLERAHADEQRVDSAVRLEVRRAWANLRAAEQRIEVAKAAVAEADESLRITQNRYEAGMSNVTELLRNETAVLESRTRFLSAVHDQRIAATMLELAAGRLSSDSEVLN
ncbi:MAG TPA: TolC family protein [Candidatus Acidoferrales bacterium]|nr:TolC family protein [Candidatus Acidoferrales bacterium]